MRLRGPSKQASNKRPQKKDVRDWAKDFCRNSITIARSSIVAFLCFQKLNTAHRFYEMKRPKPWGEAAMHPRSSSSPMYISLCSCSPSTTGWLMKKNHQQDWFHFKWVCNFRSWLLLTKKMRTFSTLSLPQKVHVLMHHPVCRRRRRQPTILKLYLQLLLRSLVYVV